MGQKTTNADRAEAAFYRDVHDSSRALARTYPEPGRKYYHEIPASDADADGFSRRVIATHRCEACGAEIGQYCRNQEGREKKTIIAIHGRRKQAYLDTLGDTPQAASSVKLSPVVNSVVFVVPVNKQAAWVVSGGAQWSRGGGKGGWRGSGPLKTRPVPKDMPSMMGRVSGKLQCVGLSASHKAGHSGNSAAVWICKCVCGYYCLRTSKALANLSKTVEDCCDVCERDRHTKFISDSPKQ